MKIRPRFVSGTKESECKGRVRLRLGVSMFGAFAMLILDNEDFRRYDPFLIWVFCDYHDG